MPERQFTTPMVIRAGKEIRLRRVRADEVGKLEDWLQDLLFRHPSLIPVEEIEPAFAGLIPLARELRTSSGPLDLLCMNSSGRLTLIETKLWRNPEARRQVIGQIINYATEISHWSYSRLANEISKAAKTADVDPLTSAARLASPEDALDEQFNARFIDTVSRDLKLGRFLLLIVGDGIHESVEEMCEYLQKAPHLGFTIGLVEIALFKSEATATDELFIQPRVLVRTREIPRTVFEIRSMTGPLEIAAVATGRSPETSIRSESGRHTLTAELFFEEFERNHGTALAFMAKQTISEAPSIGLRVDFKFSAGPLLKFDDDESGESFTFGQLTRSGTLGSSERLSWKCVNLGLPSPVWQTYHQAIVRLVPGSQRIPAKTKNVPGFERIADPNGEELSLAALLPLRDKWFAAIATTIDALRAATLKGLP